MFNPSWLFVAAIYAGAIWLAMRAGAALRWWIGGLFFLLVLLFLWQPLTGDSVDLPADFLRILPPWSALTHDHRVANRETNDIVLQIVPWAHQVRESWRSFDVPLWNPSAGSGSPL